MNRNVIKFLLGLAILLLILATIEQIYKGTYYLLLLDCILLVGTLKRNS